MTKSGEDRRREKKERGGAMRGTLGGDPVQISIASKQTLRWPEDKEKNGADELV